MAQVNCAPVFLHYKQFTACDMADEEHVWGAVLVNKCDVGQCVRVNRWSVICNIRPKHFGRLGPVATARMRGGIDAGDRVHLFSYNWHDAYILKAKDEMPRKESGGKKAAERKQPRIRNWPVEGYLVYAGIKCTRVDVSGPKAHIENDQFLKKGMPTNTWSLGRPVYDLEYADDILLVAQSARQLQSTMPTLENIASKSGLKLNKFKTMCLIAVRSWR